MHHFYTTRKDGERKEIERRKENGRWNEKEGERSRRGREDKRERGGRKGVRGREERREKETE